MPAYALFIRDQTRNPDEMTTYTAKAGPSLAGHPAKVLAAYGNQEILEGPTVEGVVIVEFPDMESAKAWYNSPAYQEARQYRFRGADYRAILVEGL